MSEPLPLQRKLRPLLRPLGHSYAALMAARRQSYLRCKRPGGFPPCISIGNISWGGTGKTPLVDWLLDWAAAKELKAAVLTRGYRGKPSLLPLPVQAETPVAECGDEPLMLARMHPEAQIVVDPKRRRAASGLLQRENIPDLLLLDDGFQHLDMPRNLDLVLLDKEDLADEWRWNLTIPAGTWREGQNALTQASAFLLKISPKDWAALADAAQKRLAPYHKPLFCFELEPLGLKELAGGAKAEATSFKNGYALLCAVGDPASVKATATAYLGREPKITREYPDHFDLTLVADDLRGLGLPIVCTAKDAVKLERLNLPQLYTLEVKPRFHASLFCAQNFQDWLDQLWGELLATRAG